MPPNIEAPESKDSGRYVSVDERWEYLIVSMILGDPFIHEFIIMMSKIANESVQTMGVRVAGAAVHLAYSCKFLNQLTDSEARWVLVHEVLHLVFHHCTVRVSVDPRMHELDNIAADLAINQLIPETGHIMRPRPEIIVPCFPEAYGFPKLLSKEQYYQLLWEKEQEDKKNGGGSSIDGKGQLVDNHEEWSDAEAEIIDEIIRNKVEHLSKSDRSWGKVTGGIKEMIIAAQKSQVAWWRILREFLGFLVTTKKESTMKRPNRRFGYPFPGTKRRHIDKILCAIDSSGSISEDSLRRFLTEINNIQETHPVDLVVFDDGITIGPIPFTRKRKTFEFKGRGGTNFQPVMDLASKGKYKSLVMLTDGCAGVCTYPVGVRDVIWCLVDDGEPPKGVEWGRRVHIKEKPGYSKAA
jgi:predicted metal-dependent peptidase